MGTQPPSPSPRERTLASSPRWQKVLGLILLVGIAAAVSAYGGYQAWGYHHLRRAEAALADYDFDKARGHLTNCLRVWPADPDTQLLLARTCRRAGDFEGARSHLKRAESIGAPTAGIDLEYLLLEVEENHPFAALAVLQRRLLAGDPDEILIVEALVKGHLKEHYLPEAVQFAEWWLQRRPDDWQALYLRARALRAGQLLPQSAGLEQARLDFGRVVELRPDHADARLQLGELLLLDGTPTEEAFRHFSKYRALAPHDVRGVLGQARCLQAFSRTAEARKILADWFAKHPDETNAEAYVLRALVEMELDGDAERALQWLQKAVSLAPRHDDAHHNLGLVLRRLGRDTAALEHEEMCREIRRTIERLRNVSMEIAKKGEGADLRLEAGRLQMKLGDEERALLWWLSALQDDPDHKPTHEALAEYYGRKGNRQLAQEHRAAALGKPRDNKPAVQRRR